MTVTVAQWVIHTLWVWTFYRIYKDCGRWRGEEKRGGGWERETFSSALGGSVSFNYILFLFYFWKSDVSFPTLKKTALWDWFISNTVCVCVRVRGYKPWTFGQKIPVFFSSFFVSLWDRFLTFYSVFFFLCRQPYPPPPPPQWRLLLLELSSCQQDMTDVMY